MNSPRRAALFTRFIQRRNFAGFPFWVSCPPATCAALEAKARAHAEARGFASAVRLADLTPGEIGVLREQQKLPERPVSFEGKRDFKRLFTRVDGGAEHALFGEVEHWTRVRDAAGLPSEIPAGGERDETLFSRSPVFGFLTSNPEWAGSGLQIEAGLHLPALAAHRRTHTLQQALGALGFELRPLTLRAPGSAESGYFRLLSRGGMDFPEEEFYRAFSAGADHALAAEAHELEQWHIRETHPLEDRAHRALRLLQEAQRLDYAKFLSLTSFARIGVYLGLFPQVLGGYLEDLRIRAQPFHLASGGPESGPEEADQLRADLCRKALTGIGSAA